jgi:hypothetical protein
MTRCSIGLLLALVLAPAYAAEDAPKATDKTKLVCTKERTTGSHLPKRVCMTQAQHEERRKQDQEAMQRLRSTRPNETSSR